MKVLVIGAGGREHAIAWKLRQSRHVRNLYCAPGNAGMERIATLVPLGVDRVDELCQFAKREKIDLTVVGPEYPLSLGIVDRFQAEGLKVFGPTRACALLEGSKSFAKEVMQAAGVRTAAYQVVRSAQELESYLKDCKIPVVLKADGLASGKGVFVCKTRDEARAAVSPLFSELKTDSVVVEEFLSGVEASFIVATNGSDIVPLAPSHDYKRIFDRDEGPNTGGMGTVCPTPRLSSEQGDAVIREVIGPVLAEFQRRGTPYCGFLYAGLMIAPSGEVKVLEFNARLGDPETQSIMRRLDSDLFELLDTLASAKADQSILDAVSWKPGSAVCVVLASEGYPANPRSGDEITGINLAESLNDVVVFHAGTARDGERLVTAGGRVLNVTATGPDLEQTRRMVYRAVDMIQFRGRQVRRDIGL